MKRSFEHEMNLLWWESMAGGVAVYTLGDDHGIIVKTMVGLGIAALVALGDRVLQRLTRTCPW